MTNRIHLASAITRNGRLLLLRPTPRSVWELPGGPLLEHHADAEAAMDEILASLGIDCPAIEDDFVDTVYVPAGDGSQVILNLYAPSDWRGEPEIPIGMGSGWFTFDELESIEMDASVRESLLVAFGLKMPADQDAAILAALEGRAQDEEYGTSDSDSGDSGEAASSDQPELSSAPPSPFTIVPRSIGVVGDSEATPSRRERGLDVLRTLRGADDSAAAAAAFVAMRQGTPEIAADVVDFALGEVWATAALDRKTRSLQVVAMLAALGGRTGPLRSHIGGALNHGATPEQIVETLRMVSVYAGFPAALEAWPIMEAVFQSRGIERPRLEQ